MKAIHNKYTINKVKENVIRIIKSNNISFSSFSKPPKFNIGYQNIIAFLLNLYIFSKFVSKDVYGLYFDSESVSLATMIVATYSSLYDNIRCAYVDFMSSFHDVRNLKSQISENNNVISMMRDELIRKDTIIDSLKIQLLKETVSNDVLKNFMGNNLGWKTQLFINMTPVVANLIYKYNQPNVPSLDDDQIRSMLVTIINLLNQNNLNVNVDTPNLLGDLLNVNAPMAPAPRNF
jgi:hypothetical protein